MMLAKNYAGGRGQEGALNASVSLEYWQEADDQRNWNKCQHLFSNRNRKFNECVTHCHARETIWRADLIV